MSLNYLEPTLGPDGTLLSGPLGSGVQASIGLGATISSLFCLCLYSPSNYVAIFSHLTDLTWIAVGFSFTGSLLGTDLRIPGGNFSHDCRVCLWNWELCGAQQLPHNYLRCALFVLCHHPLCHFHHRHRRCLPPHQAHPRRACEYPFVTSLLSLFSHSWCNSVGCCLALAQLHILTWCPHVTWISCKKMGSKVSSRTVLNVCLQQRVFTAAHALLQVLFSLYSAPWVTVNVQGCKVLCEWTQGCFCLGYHVTYGNWYFSGFYLKIYLFIYWKDKLMENVGDREREWILLSFGLLPKWPQWMILGQVEIRSLGLHIPHLGLQYGHKDPNTGAIFNWFSKCIKQGAVLKVGQAGPEPVLIWEAYVA